jgi:hypothetical protein
MKVAIIFEAINGQNIEQLRDFVKSNSESLIESLSCECMVLKEEKAEIFIGQEVVIASKLCSGCKNHIGCAYIETPKEDGTCKDFSDKQSAT